MKKSSPWWWTKMSQMSQEGSTTQPVITVTDYLLSASGEMELVSEEDDRFFCGPSEDIWKKFELLPTPPRSPSRPSGTSDDDEEMCVLPGHKLNLVSDLLDSPDVIEWELCQMTPLGLKNDLLHDCMWSGQCTDTCKRGHHDTFTLPLATDSPCDFIVPDSLVVPDTAPTLKPCIKLEPVDPEPEPTPPSDVVPSPNLYVDPCTMLPYTPLSDHSYHTQQRSEQFSNPRTPPICDTPSDTDDEIDVVTLPQHPIKTEPIHVVSPTPKAHTGTRFVVTSTGTSPRKRIFTVAPQPSPTPQPTVPPLRVVLSTKRHYKERRSASRKRFQKRRNTVPSSTSSGSKAWPRRPYNKRRYQIPPPPLPPQQVTRTYSCSSDSEDCVEKRSMHNSMERKRRDDLRYAFQTLREHVPELASNPKAPKVLILNRAASYARQLYQTGQNLEKALKQEAKRQVELKRRLQQLSK